MSRKPRQPDALPFLPFFPFYVESWLSSATVAQLSLAEQGAFVRLLAWSWRLGPLPDDHPTLAKYCGLEPGSEQALAIIPRAFNLGFPQVVPAPEQGHRTVHRTEYRANPRLEQERARATLVYLQRVNSSRVAAEQRLRAKRDAARQLGGAPNGVPDGPPNGPPYDPHNIQSTDNIISQVERLPVEWREALQPHVARARNRVAMVQSLVALESGMHGQRYNWAVIVRALDEMAASGAPFSPKVLRGFCRSLAAEAENGRPPTTAPRRKQGATSHASKVARDAQEFLERGK